MTLNELVKLTTLWTTGPCYLSKQCRWRLIWVCNVCQCPSPGFTDNPLYTALWHHSEKNSLAINNRYLSSNTVWWHWSIVIMWTTAVRKLWCLYILWLDCKQSIKKNGSLEFIRTATTGSDGTSSQVLIFVTETLNIVNVSREGKRLCGCVFWSEFAHFTCHYENMPIRMYWKFNHQKMKIFI